MVEYKTADIKEYMRTYMKEYNKTAPTLTCEICNGLYKKQNYQKHCKTNKHIKASNKESILENKLKEISEELILIRLKKK